MIKKLKESYSPEVGPFYVIDGAVFADTEDVREVELVSGFKDSNNTHYDYWELLKRIYPEFRNKDYDFYPRGRVVYSKDKDTYFVYLDKCLQATKIIREILSELGLPLRKVEVAEDEHYQCSNCNSDYALVSENILY